MWSFRGLRLSLCRVLFSFESVDECYSDKGKELLLRAWMLSGTVEVVVRFRCDRCNLFRALNYFVRNYARAFSNLLTHALIDNIHDSYNVRSFMK